MTQQLNLLNDNVITANSRAFFKRNSASSSISSGSNWPLFSLAGANTFNIGGGFTITSETTVTCNFDGYVNFGGVMVGGSSINWRSVLKVAGSTVQDFLAYQTANAIYSAPWSATFQVSEGDTIEFENSSGASSTVGDNGFCYLERISDFSAGQPVGFGLATANLFGLVKKNTFQRKDLSSDLDLNPSPGIISDLSFTGLEVGATYKYTCVLNYRPDTTGPADCTLHLRDDTTNTGVGFSTQWNTAVGSTNNRRGAVITDIVTMASTSLNLFNETGADIVLVANTIHGTPQKATYAILERLNNY